MKLLHISDLHIGKRVKGFSLIEDQKYILEQIITAAKDNNVDGIIIAGDIYDISMPSNEAVVCFDNFISDIHSLGISCYVVSGNHDSIYRVAFGSNIMAKENIYFAKKYTGKLEPIEAAKDINIWLLPFMRPADVRDFHSDFSIGNYDEMVQTVIKNADIDEKKTNILVAHQFVTYSGKAPEISESETVSLGTLDNVEASDFDKFDYVALGHIHKPQAMGRDTVRYAGSPLKYSFSEKDDKKAMVLLDVSGKKINIEFIPYKPLRDMKEFKGTYEELSKLPKTDDYVSLVLKDENMIIDIKHKLENIFTNIMEIRYENAFTSKNNSADKAQFIEQKTPLELFEGFYEVQNNKKLDGEHKKIVKEIFEEMEEAE